MADPENYLRTLAAEAFLAAEPWVRYNPTEMLTDAVLTTVLPAHRAMVLAKAADAIETLLDHYHQDLTLDTPADTAAYRAGRGAVMDAVTVVRRLAATTPADQDSPRATGQATAVPEPRPEPTPDLRTLAAGRIAARDHAEGLRDDDIPTLGDYDRADAALSVLPTHRAMVLGEAGDPEPCPLDHRCEEGEVCGCWCDLHDCAIAECPTFVTVEAWITGMREKHEAALARIRATVLAEVAGLIRDEADRWDRLGYDDEGAWRVAVRIAATGAPVSAATTPADQGGPGTTEQATAAPEPKSEPIYRVGRKVGRTIYRHDMLIGVMDTPELAAHAVEAMNQNGREEWWK